MLTLMVNVKLVGVIPLPNKLERVLSLTLWVNCGHWTSFLIRIIHVATCLLDWTGVPNAIYVFFVLLGPKVWHHSLLIIWQTIIIWPSVSGLFWYSISNTVITVVEIFQTTANWRKDLDCFILASFLLTVIGVKSWQKDILLLRRNNFNQSEFSSSEQSKSLFSSIS